jgi:hypothetical protein
MSGLSCEIVDLDAFAALSLAEKVRVVRQLSGSRLWSAELSTIWIRLMQRPCTAETREILTREALCMAPSGEDAETLLRQLMPASFPAAPSRAVHLLISCQPYLGKATALLQQVRPRFPDIYIVLGDPTRRTAAFEDHFLHVPAPDDYESLPSKVLEAFYAVRRRFGEVGVVKMDDDLRDLGGEFPPVEQFFATADYAGEPAGSPALDRTWHIGKCSDRQLAPYGRRFLAAWARGPLYWISARALSILVEEHLRYPGELAGEIYEDKYVGDVLHRAGIALHACDLGSLLGLALSNESRPGLE